MVSHFFHEQGIDAVLPVSRIEIRLDLRCDGAPRRLSEGWDASAALERLSPNKVLPARFRIDCLNKLVTLCPIVKFIERLRGRRFNVIRQFISRYRFVGEWLMSHPTIRATTKFFQLG